MNPTWNQWETARFSVFARQSRVEINTQKDLEDMLAKLDDERADVDAIKAQQMQAVEDKRRRRFLELALPSGLLSFLSLVYCLLFLADASGNIMEATKMSAAISKSESLEIVGRYLIDEYKATIVEHDQDELSNIMINTDIALDALFTEKTLEVWKILSDIRDWRNLGTRDIYDISEFYLYLYRDSTTLALKESLSKLSIRNWKMYYEYRKESEEAFVLNILTLLLEHSNDSLEVKHESMERLVRFTSKFDHMLCKTETESVSRSIACSHDLYITLQHVFYKKKMTNAALDSNDNITDELVDFTTDLNANITTSNATTDSIETEMTNNTIDSNRNSTVSTLDMYNSTFISNLCKLKTNQALDKLYQLKQSTTRSLTHNVAMIILSLLCIGCVVSCVMLSIFIFRNQITVAVFVSHWLNGVTTKMNEQRESTVKVMNQLVPRVLAPKFAASEQINMIPYQVTATTLFLVSIAGFSELFNSFPADQVLHILSLVMELLDERMEQYNVFPVSRMGQYLLVVSDTVGKKQIEHACEIANLAIDIMTCCSDLEIGRYSTTKLQMKLAIHTGPCCGRLVLHDGTVQLKLTGSTLTVLQMLHETAIPNMIQVSESTHTLLATCEIYCMRYRGNLKIPGMSNYYKVYWLNGRKVSSSYDRDSACSVMGSWIELEKRPLYKLVESEGIYAPINKTASKRYSQMTVGSYNRVTSRCSQTSDRISESSL